MELIEVLLVLWIYHIFFAPDECKCKCRGMGCECKRRLV